MLMLRLGTYFLRALTKPRRGISEKSYACVLRMHGSKKISGEAERGWANGVCSFKNEEFKIVDMLSQEYPVKDICKMMGVSRSGYYKWLRREPSSREINREFMVGVVEDIHSEHPTHGYRWVAAYIRINLQLSISDNFSYKCFQYLGIQSQTRHKIHYKPRKVKDKYPNLIFPRGTR